MKLPAQSRLILTFLPLVFFFAFSVSLLTTCFYCLFKLTPADINKLVKQYAAFSSEPPVVGEATQRFTSQDARADVLSSYFESQSSPLAPYGNFFVHIADKYGLDWTLLPAISMQESNGGKKIPEGSHNPFGWAVYTNMEKRFNSWEESIEAVAKGIKEEYVSLGLVTPDQIMSRYNPISHDRDGSWAKGVQYFIELLRNY